MDANSAPGPESKERESAWAQKVSRMRVTAPPPGATNINVDGRQLVSPLQGFGQLWQKTFKVRLTGVKMTPAQVMEIWKANFPKFQPRENIFYPSMAGIKPGEVFLIEAKVPAFPGTPSVLPVSTGVMILYADDVSFTVMNPEGHPLSGWNTFSVYEEDGCVVAQVQEQSRPSDPLYEFFNRFLGASGQQDKIWHYVLGKVAEHFGVNGQVTQSTVLIDPKVQWSEARMIWKNAAIRTVFYYLTWPVRKLTKAGRKTPR
jgi:hypothetical protein